MHYFEDLDTALGEYPSIVLGDGTQVNRYSGQATAIQITQPGLERTIDLSQGPDGELLDGIETRVSDAPHDDERDRITSIRKFPENEGDIEFITNVANAIRARREVETTKPAV